MEGGAANTTHFSNFMVDEDSAIACTNNQAYNGGAMYIILLITPVL